MAQLADIDTRIINVVGIFVTPDLFEQFALADDMARIFDQHQQQLKFGGRQVDLYAIDRYQAALWIDRQEAIIITGTAVGRGRLRPPQKRTHPGSKFFEAHWLDQILIGTSIQAINDVFFANGLCRKHHDRRFGDLADTLTDRQAVHFGHYDIEHHQIRMIGMK